MKYEYKITNLTYGTIQEQEAILNKLGEQGYKLVSMQGTRVIFERATSE